MDVMSDEQVGELWAQKVDHWTYGYGLSSDPSFHADPVVMLIRKLVQERAQTYVDYDRYRHNGVSYALGDFGIPKETWK